MVTKLSNKYGIHRSVQEYIDLIVKDHLPNVTVLTVARAYKLCDALDGNTWGVKTQLALALIFMASIESGEKVSLNKLKHIAAPNSVRSCVRAAQDELIRKGHPPKGYLRFYSPQRR